MNEPNFRVLSELAKVEDFLDDPVFSDVTNHGETYTRYRVIRITHELIDDPQGWTHVANVTPERELGIGVARLKIIDRAIEESEVTISDVNG